MLRGVNHSIVSQYNTSHREREKEREGIHVLPAGGADEFRPNDSAANERKNKGYYAML